MIDLEMLLNLAGIDGLALRIDAWGNHIRPLVHVGEEKRGADAGTSVEPRAPIAMPASPDLEVERAVHPILLRSEDRRQVLRHRTVLMDLFPKSTAVKRLDGDQNQIGLRIEKGERGKRKPKRQRMRTK